MAKVTLLAHTPNPEATVAAAAKLCYSPATIESIQEGLTPEKTAAVVEMLAEIGHESPKQKIVSASKSSVIIVSVIILSPLYLTFLILYIIIHLYLYVKYIVLISDIQF